MKCRSNLWYALNVCQPELIEAHFFDSQHGIRDSFICTILFHRVLKCVLY